MNEETPRSGRFLRQPIRPDRDGEAAAFAAIVTHLGDPEWRRARWIAIAVSIAFLVAAIVVLWLSRWPVEAIVRFGVTLLAGAVGWAAPHARWVFRR